MFPWIILVAAQAQTVREVPDAYGTVNAAVIAADPGDVIEVDASSGWTRDTLLEVPIGKNLTIRGVNGRPELPRLSVEAANLTLENVSLKGPGVDNDPGAADLAVRVTSGSLTARDVTMLPNGGSYGLLAFESDVTLTTVDASNFWNPVVVVEGGSLQIDQSSFQANLNGVVETVDADVTVMNSTFVGNVTYDGAACLHVANTLRHGLTIENTLFDYSDGLRGGAVHAFNADVVVSATDFNDVWSLAEGGALYVGASTTVGGSLHLDQSSVSHCFGTEGGGVAIQGLDSAVVSDTSFVGNIASTRGGALVVHGDVEVTGSSFRGNSVWFGDGGAVALGSPSLGFSNSIATVDLEDVEFKGPLDYSAAWSGGCVHAREGRTVRVRGGSFEDCVSVNGGAIASYGAELSLTNDVAFRDNVANWGGAVWQELGSLFIDGATFEGNTGSTSGAVKAKEAIVDIDHATFLSNLSDDGHILEVTDAAHLSVRHSLFCSNVAANSGAIVFVRGADGAQYPFDNNVWMFNAVDLGSVLDFAPSDWLLNLGPKLAVRNNDFIQNATSTAIHARGDIELRNNIIGAHPIGFLLDEHPNNTLTAGYNLWLGNGSNAEGTTGLLPTPSALLEVDPLFQGLVAGDCASNLWLQPGSPARDAGDPTIFDPDGSRSDIGAFGGPRSELADRDADGWFEDLDCDDDNDRVHPGLEDTPYDGIDNNCDGADRCDVDGDGFLSEACAGVDCDDSDPRVHPGARDVADDGIDNNCDGFEPRTWVSGGSSCGADHTGGLPAASWMLALLALTRRRVEG